MGEEELSGLKALVTGGGSGIGLATARLLSRRGASVACLDLDPSAATEPVLALRGDVSDDSVGDVVGEAARRLGGLDILVNNAGVLSRGTVADHDTSEWLRVFDVNVFGMARVTRAALPWLRASKAAAVVNTCSLGAVVGLPGAVVYCASKGAVYGLTLAMAADHLAEGVRVNCVVPGPVDTPWVRRVVEAADDPGRQLAAAHARQPIGRMARADEVAAAIAYLASPVAGSTTGTSIVVDGGTRGVVLGPRPPAGTATTAP